MQKVPCLVCSKPYDGTTHCSVTACRACAMFFRRCETLEIPLCKTGSNNCKLNEPRRIPCSFCRYERCLKAGLKVQATSRSSKSVSPDSNQIQLTEINQRKFGFDLLMLVPETMPTLKRYCYNYAITANTRKNYELTLLREDGEQLMTLPGNRQMGYMNQTRNSTVWKYNTSDISSLNGSFPAFSKIDVKKQDVLVHMINFLLLDLSTCFRTWRVFNDVNINKLICSETMFVDFDNMRSYVDGNGTLDPLDLKTITDFLSTNWRYLLRETLRLLRHMKITDVEYLATSCLLIWDEDNFDFIPHLAQTAKAHRTLIYKDLDYYYRNILHMDNYVEKIMNIKELIRTLRTNLELMTSSVHFLRIFNYFQGNEELGIATEKVFNIIEKKKLK